MQIFQMLTHVIQYSRPHLLISPLLSLENLYILGCKDIEADTSFPKLWFHMKTWVLILTKQIAVFLEVIGSLYSFLRKCLQRTQAWITIVCPSVILSSKNSVPQNRDLLCLATQNIMSIFSWKNHHTPLYNKSVSGILPILSFRM